jgi:hypothetical protein
MEQNSSNYAVSERRGKPRVDCDYPAVVKGQDGRGKKYEEIARLKNMSASGLYLQLKRPIVEGDELRVTISLPNYSTGELDHKIITRGVVVRTEQHDEGTVGIGLKILHHRFA